MRTAEEILNQFYNIDEGFTGYEKECMEKAINEARKEAIEAAYELALLGNGKEILSLIDKLK